MTTLPSVSTVFAVFERRFREPIQKKPGQPAFSGCRALR
jgi:hypothetical protein